MSIGGAPDSLAQLPQFLLAERQQESGGDYTASNPSGASGAYQFEQGTWTSDATSAGYSQYANAPAASAPPQVQDAVASYAMTQYFNQFGNWTDVAKAWYAGGGFAQDNQTAPQSGGPSIDDYANDVMSIMYGSTTTTGQSDVGTSTTDTSGNTIPTPPSTADTAAMVAYIKQYFGADAWMLNIPGVASVLEQAVAQGYGNDSAYLQGVLQQTSWYQTVSKAVQTYTANRATTPAEYSFTAPGSLAQQTLADVKAAAAKTGVGISTLEAQQLATNYLEYGWDANELDAALGDAVYYTAPANSTSAGQANTNAGQVAQQITAAAAQYYQTLTPAEIQSWAQNIAAGTQTIDQFNAMMAKDASIKWTGMAPQIAQGYTPEQITSSLRNQAASVMEVDPSQVNFQSDPFYSKILDYVPPNSPNGVHRIMTQSEMDTYLKSSNQWDTTQQARDSAATLEQQITQTFGKTG